MCVGWATAHIVWNVGSVECVNIVNSYVRWLAVVYTHILQQYMRWRCVECNSRSVTLYAMHQCLCLCLCHSLVRGQSNTRQERALHACGGDEPSSVPEYLSHLIIYVALTHISMA